MTDAIAAIPFAGAKKPILGYSSRTAAVLALQAEGKATNEIAHLLGIQVKTVSALACSAKRRRYAQPKDSNAAGPRLRREVPSQSVSVSTLLPIDVRSELAKEARVRDVSIDRLIFDLLAAIARDGLANAVLDDRGDQ